MIIKILLDGKEVEARVTENMGYQGGRLTKAVEYEGEEHIVQKYGDTWKPREISEKFGLWRVKF